MCDICKKLEQEYDAKPLPPAHGSVTISMRDAKRILAFTRNCWADPKDWMTINPVQERLQRAMGSPNAQAEARREKHRL